MGNEYVDISKWCNRKFIFEKSEDREGIEGLRLSRSYLRGGILQNETYRFKATEGETDIIECGGQRISFPGDKRYSNLDISGFSVFGSYRNRFKVEYVDGKEQSEWLFFQEAGHFGKTCVALEREYNEYYDTGETVLIYESDEEGGKRKAQIFAHRIKLDNKRRPTALILPENNFTCVFGVTLKR